MQLRLSLTSYQEFFVPLNRAIISVGLLAGAGVFLPTTTMAEDFAGTVDTNADRWMYPFNATPGTRPAGSIFGFVSVPPSSD